MKKLYYLDEEEKQRILHLHESQTKKQYLMNEQELEEDLASVAWATGKGAATGGLLFGAPGAVVGGAIGLISSITSGMNRDAFNSTVTQVCSAGAGKPTMNGGQLMDVAKKLNDLINTPNLMGGGYATNESRTGISSTLSGIPSIPDLCGVMAKYKEIYNIDLLADLKREIYYDKNWTDTVKLPLMKAVETSKELTQKAQEQGGTTGAGGTDCVTKNPNAKDNGGIWQIPEGDKIYYYNVAESTYSVQKYNPATKTYEYYNPGGGAVAQQKMKFSCEGTTIKREGEPSSGAGGGTGGGGTGGGYATRIQNIQKQLGIKTSGVMDQATIDAIANKIKGGGTKTAAPTASPTSDL